MGVLTSSVGDRPVGCASAGAEEYMATTPDEAKPAPLPKSNRSSARHQRQQQRTRRCRDGHAIAVDADAVQSREIDAAPTDTIVCIAMQAHGTPSAA
jgi:hypothetical protein